MKTRVAEFLYQLTAPDGTARAVPTWHVALEDEAETMEEAAALGQLKRTRLVSMAVAVKEGVDLSRLLGEIAAAALAKADEEGEAHATTKRERDEAHEAKGVAIKERDQAMTERNDIATAYNELLPRAQQVARDFQELSAQYNELLPAAQELKVAFERVNKEATEQRKRITELERTTKADEPAPTDASAE